MRMKRLTPMLSVADIDRSLRFYQEVAGFELRSPREARAPTRIEDCNGASGTGSSLTAWFDLLT